MNWRSLFFGFESRIGRLTCLIALLMLLAAYILLMWIVFTVAGIPYDAIADPDPRVAVARIGITLALLYPTLAVTTKRLHDRNRTGWWVGVYLAITFLIDAADLAGLSGTGDNPSLLFIGLAVALLGFSVWLLIELLLLRGTRGQNRFGPDPLAAAPAGN